VNDPAASLPGPDVFPGLDGFLGTRASLGTDLVFVALFAVLPMLAWSIHMVRHRRAYAVHKRMQLLISAALLLAIVIFEVDMRFVSGWKPRAVASPYWPGGVMGALGVHLCFAVTTVGVWAFVVFEAIRRFPSPPEPGPHGVRHRFWARLAAADLVMTAVTGWIFYYVAFAAA
jgi:uncharacterized membrane protein YozB (DUF420 family)